MDPHAAPLTTTPTGPATAIEPAATSDPDPDPALPKSDCSTGREVAWMKGGFRSAVDLSELPTRRRDFSVQVPPSADGWVGGGNRRKAVEERRGPLAGYSRPKHVRSRNPP